MRMVLQRVSSASVSINNEAVASIDHGLMILLAIEDEDTQQDIDWLVRKALNMRIFSDDSGKMNKSILEQNYSTLVVSQFTLFASTKKGNRPSFVRSGNPVFSKKMYDIFIEEMTRHVVCKSGVFGADMQVSLVNDGPVTILLDSKNKE